ncbi:hypothetical protein N7513_003543 [Penicillium frequentans]|nr:hypothetical protein N7513_003543 [Penicillium glabrum]
MGSAPPDNPPPDSVVITLEDVDIPMSALQSQNPDINRFSAGFIILRPDPTDSLKQQALLIQRGYDGSWGESWEGPGGGYDCLKDKTIKETALRETEEESGVIVPLRSIFPFVYKREFEHKGLQMAYFTFIAQLDADFSVALSHEHLDWRFFGEEDIQNLGSFDKTKSRQVNYVMLESKRQTLCHVFENMETLKQSDEHAILRADISY